MNAFLRSLILLAVIGSGLPCAYAARWSATELMVDPFQVGTSLDYGFLDEPVNGIVQNRLSFSQAVAKTEDSVWRALGRFSNFGENGIPYPSALWDLEAGASYDRRVDDRRVWGARVTVGSASDIPFNSLNETVVQATAHYRLPSGERNSWLFSLSYSNNREFANNVPIPGVAYIVRSPADRFVGIFGLPFAAFNWRLNESLALRLSYLFPENLSAELSGTLSGPLRVFVAFDWSQESWLEANRSDLSNRLYFDSKSATGGFRMPVAKGVFVEASGGYSFARRFFEAHSVFQSKATDFDLSPSPVAQARVSARF